MPSEVEEIEEPEDLAETDLDALPDDVDDLIDDDALAVDEDDDDDGLVADVVEEEAVPDVPVAAKPAAAGEDEDEEEEEDHDEDVEASLDVILKERLVVEEPEEDEDAPEPEDRSEGVDRVLPKQPDEFVCRSCFLVKHPNQLADQKKMLCRDCV
ncbi:MAG TPA: DUF4193 family protein [Acidimicrobiales bacterium]|jgi:hypothetical protein|nr:DUF4193 family protein [Acidimicrobiales bacterium]